MVDITENLATQSLQQRYGHRADILTFVRLCVKNDSLKDCHSIHELEFWYNVYLEGLGKLTKFGIFD